MGYTDNVGLGHFCTLEWVDVVLDVYDGYPLDRGTKRTDYALTTQRPEVLLTGIGWQAMGS